MELQDAATGMTLARAADDTGTAELASPTGQDTSWNQVRAAAERWASRFRAFLDRNLQSDRNT